MDDIMCLHCHLCTWRKVFKYKYMHKLHPWDSKPPSHHPVTLQACAPNDPFLLLQLMPPWQLFWDLRHLGLDVSRKLYNRWPTAMIGSLTYLFAISLPVLKERMSLPAKWQQVQKRLCTGVPRWWAKMLSLAFKQPVATLGDRTESHTTIQ